MFKNTILTFFVFLTVNCYADDTNKVTTTANMISKEFDSNELAADAKYKDKDIKIFGKVFSVGNDSTGNPYVQLDGYTMFKSVILKVNSDDEFLLKISRNDKVYATCSSASQVIGTVVLRDCKINHYSKLAV